MPDLTHNIFVEVVEDKRLPSFRGKVNRTTAELMGLGKVVMDIQYSRTEELYSAMIIYKEHYRWKENDASGVWHPEEEKD